jgi:ribonucleoside-diphosphate reductase beta chain
MTKRIKMKQRTDSFVVHYPEAIEFAETQLKILWFPNEIKVSKDVHDILTNMTPAEKHGVITVLKLFTLYEAKAGTDYWTGRYMRTYKRPEMQRMASVFGMFELAIHAPFYNLINEALHLNTDEFYESYTQNETLKDRMQFIDDCIRDKDDLFSVAVFSLVEGAILYSSFAFLKHFQTKGKNKLLNTIRGINFSTRDENIHSIAGAWTFRKHLEEEQRTTEEIESVNARIIEAAKKIYEHEEKIVDMIFEQGDIEGTDPTDLKMFVKSRINICLSQLNIPPIYEVVDNTIETWFYDSINKFVFNDFFSGIGREYSRDWEEQNFTWEPSSEV